MLLSDRKHRSWVILSIVAAVVAGAVYWTVDHRLADGLTGGTMLGLVFGIVGYALMLFTMGLWMVRKLADKGWWVAPRQAWLRGHIWLGLLSVVLIVFHSGARWGGTLEVTLWILLILSVVSGIYGLVLQQIVPRMMSMRISWEAPYTQIPFVCEQLRRKADQRMDELCAAVGLQRREAEHLDISTAPTPSTAHPVNELLSFYRQQVRPFLDPQAQRSLSLASARTAASTFSRIRSMPQPAEMKETLVELESFCDERRQLAEQERLHQLLHGWLVVHIPISFALVVLGAVHAIMTLYY